VNSEKSKAGRKPFEDPSMVKINLTGKVNRDHVEKVIRVGNGNVSLGMRIAIEAYQENGK